jgi:cytoskeletal protein RodZ
MSDYSHTVLTELDIRSYREAVDLGTDQLLQRMDEQNPSVAPSDAFLALVVLAAVRELRESTRDIKAAVVGLEETTRSLDKARRHLDWTVAILAALALVVAILQLAG